MKNITKDKNSKELRDLLKEKRSALTTFRTDVYQGKAKNVKEGRTIRKNIAQILTVLHKEDTNK